MMTLRSAVAKLAAKEDLNFILTNRIPRRLVTRFVGWLSKIEQPLVRDASIGVWRLFTDLDLRDAKTTRFKSLHECFVRELKPGARRVEPDPRLLVSPCDAIVGAGGAIAGTQVFQIKGSSYDLGDLLCDATLCDEVRDGTYVTLRLTSAMYHRFHAPSDCRVESVHYVPGDTWNVNPAALKRVKSLYCKNERATLAMRLAPDGARIVVVPVAAILVASLRLRFLEADLRRRDPYTLACDAHFRRGEEIGWFEHGSTIVVFAPSGFRLCESVLEGSRIQMGQPLMWLGRARAASSDPAAP